MDKASFYRYLTSLPNVDAKDDWWCCTRCVLCGDSKKSMLKKRLYINVDPTKPDDPVWFKCFNCNACSVLTQQMLADIVGEAKADMEASMSLRKINYHAMKDRDGSRTVNRFQNDKVIPVEFPPLRNVDYQLNKYRYLCKERLGVMIKPEDFGFLKIVWSLKDFLELNHIELNRKCQIPPALLERDYIGFVSVKNEYILFRDVTGQNKFRWYKYNIFGMQGNLSSYYAVKNGIDRVSMGDIHIIAAEGTMDTLGILYHFYHGDRGNNIFLSVANGAFREPIMNYIMKGLVGSNIYVDMYLDNDTKYNFKELKKDLSLFVKPHHIKAFHNTKQKDFGYPMEDIEIEEILI